MNHKFLKYLVAFIVVFPNFISAREINPNFSKAQISQQDLNCLTVAVYKEARGESYKGKLAVTEVIRNRVGHPDFKQSICCVVQQRGQFSWYNGPRSLQIKPGQLKHPQDKRSYAEANKAAMEALNGSDVAHGGLYFVHRRVAKKQQWLKKKKFVVMIGAHRFYKD